MSGRGRSRYAYIVCLPVFRLCLPSNSLGGQAEERRHESCNMVCHTRLTSAQSYKNKSPKHQKKLTQGETCSLVDVATATRSLLDKFSSNQGRFAQNMRQVLCVLEKLAAVGDVFAQWSPHIGSPIWGSLRFLIQVSAPQASLRNNCEYPHYIPC